MHRFYGKNDRRTLVFGAYLQVYIWHGVSSARFVFALDFQLLNVRYIDRINRRIRPLSGLNLIFVETEIILSQLNPSTYALHFYILILFKKKFQ